MIEFKCVKCNQAIAADDGQAGLSVACPKCKTLLYVPSYTGRGDLAPWVMPAVSACLLVAAGAIYGIAAYVGEDVGHRAQKAERLLVSLRSWAGFMASCLLAGLLLLAFILARLHRKDGR